MPVMAKSNESGMAKRHDERCPPVAQAETEHGDNQQRSLEQIPRDSRNRLIDKGRAIVNGRDFDTGGQLLPDLLNASSTRLAMRRLFSPDSIKAAPRTASAPLWVADPVRIFFPISTSARSSTRSGSAPARNFTGRFPISFADWTRPLVRIAICSPPS